MVVDGLPWSDGAGGNQGIDMVLASGGTLHIDDGQGTESGYGRTIDNLSDARPTIYFNVRFHKVAIRTKGRAVPVVPSAPPPSAEVKMQASGPSFSILREFAFAYS